MNKILKNSLILTVFILLVELIFKLIAGYNIISFSVCRIIISNFILSLIVSFITSFISKRKAVMVINLIIILLVSLYAFLQLGFNNFIGVYISFGASSQLGAVVDYIREFLLSFKVIYYLCFIPVILMIIYYILLDKRILVENVRLVWYKKVPWTLGLIIVSSILYMATLVIPFMQSSYQLVANLSLFKNPSVSSIAINQFGTTTFVILDFKSYLFPSSTTNSMLYEYEDEVKEELGDREIDDTRWLEVIEEEDDKILNELNNYFISQSITSKNEYTGLFEDKNLIVIMMESVNDIIINQDLYPNFYKLYSKGWNWENNYSPRNSCSTGNNETSGMLSLYSIYNICTANVYKDNLYPQSIFNLFNEDGYNTFSAHNYTEHYYYRSTIHTNMGSNSYYGVEDLDIEYSDEYKNWSNDDEFMEKVLEILDNYESDDKIMAWLTTVSSHQPYNLSSIQGDRYYDLTENLEYSNELRRYMSKLKILDEALGILIDGLEERGVLDDYVFILYGDHYPYGLNNSTINQVLEYSLDDYEVERVPFIIYNSEQEPKTFTEYTSFINIVPTVANLFNLDYDPRLYVGDDLLSPDYQSVVVFADGSWKNENVYYDASNSKVIYYREDSYTSEEILAISAKVQNKIYISKQAIENNYFYYLNSKLKEETQ